MLSGTNFSLIELLLSGNCSVVMAECTSKQVRSANRHMLVTRHVLTRIAARALISFILLKHSIALVCDPNAPGSGVQRGKESQL